MLAEELTAVAAERTAQPAVLLDGFQGFDELRMVFVVETRVAADALAFQHVALGVGEHRPPERPGFERHHREALVIRRHEEQIGGRHRVELVIIVQKTEVTDPRMFRNRQQANCPMSTSDNLPCGSLR